MKQIFVLGRGGGSIKLAERPSKWVNKPAARQKVPTFETYHPIAPLLNSILDLIPDPFKICDRTFLSFCRRFEKIKKGCRILTLFDSPAIMEKEKPEGVLHHEQQFECFPDR
jgi:hypothetical protein